MPLASSPLASSTIPFQVEDADDHPNPNPFASVNNSPVIRPSSALPSSSSPSPMPHLALAQSTGVTPAGVTRKRRPIPQSTLLSHTRSIPKPWLEKPSTRAAVSYWMVYFMVFVGFAVGGIQIILTWRSTVTRIVDPARKGRDGGLGPLCLQFDESFDYAEGQDPFGKDGKWNREVSMDGFGNGQFEMTTNSPNNSFVSNGILHIIPTLTADVVSEDLMRDGGVYNISGCTYNLTHSPIDPRTGKFPMDDYLNSCSAVSNSTTGRIINPVQSARINTLGKKGGHLKYGMVEVRAKMPRGDWLWPAIWMLPVPKDGAFPPSPVSNDTNWSPNGHYGAWPRSGEIDIVESRGNGIRYTANGRNFVQGSLHWGIAPEFDRVSKSYSWWSDRRKGFDEDWNTYRMEWTEKFLRVSVNSRLHTLIDYGFDKPFFDKGEFPSVYTNSSTGALTQLSNPWSAPASASSANAAPFDQPFYLIINLAVGGRNGWFPEGQGTLSPSSPLDPINKKPVGAQERGGPDSVKPWLDRSRNAPLDFWNARERWWPTWLETGDKNDKRFGESGRAGGMQVDYVKIWGRCGEQN